MIHSENRTSYFQDCAVTGGLHLPLVGARTVGGHSEEERLFQPTNAHSLLSRARPKSSQELVEARPIKAGFDSSIVSFLQIVARFPFVLQWCHLVGIDADHKVVDVIINPGEPVPGTGRNNNDVAGL